MPPSLPEKPSRPTPTVVPDAADGGLARRVRALGRRLATFWDTQRELHERRALRDRPWEERFFHWALVDGEWVLHGDLTPPRRGTSTTRDGWCPAAGTRGPHA